MLSYLNGLGVAFEKEPTNDLLAAICSKKLGLALDFRTQNGIDEMMRRMPSLNPAMKCNGKLRTKKRQPWKPDSAFYQTREWQELRYQALKANDGRCELCGASKSDGAQLHVDHIKPRSKYPDLQLALTNLQVLCKDCNLGKSNKDETDWRTTVANDDEFAEIRQRLGEAWP